MVSRRDYLKSIVVVPLVDRFVQTETFCSVCGQRCIGEADSKAVKEWEETDNNSALICWNADEGNLYVHTKEENKC